MKGRKKSREKFTAIFKMDHQIIFALSVWVLAFGEGSSQFIVGAGNYVSSHFHIFKYYQNMWLESLFMNTKQEFDDNAMSHRF